ncbi:MAG TPA: SAM-dependent methyltransferase [Thermoplasmata archaeon]|nr:SAM-dependent methyltransferase [Thermoplasmata archaeon]
MPESIPPVDAEALARSRIVLDRLRVLAGDGGVLPFDRFMEVALYGKDVGFYERTRTPLGRTGDFYTAAHTTPLFAQTLAQRIRTIRRALGGSSVFWVVELGPGDGTLAEGVLRSLKDDPPGLEYILVERSDARLRETRDRLRTSSGSISVRTAASVGSLGAFRGVAIGNEFLDAQPARRLRWHDGEWHEVGVRVRDDRVESTELPVERAVPGRALPTPAGEPLTVEISPAAEGTVREVADHLVAGAAIFLDYGAEETELVRGHPDGTLAGVRDHRFLANPLDAPGTADLSTFVNFSRVRDVALASGLVPGPLRSQAETLGAWGYPALLDAAVRAAPTAESRVRVQMASKNLLFGFDRFRVLELAPPSSAAKLGAGPKEPSTDAGR